MLVAPTHAPTLAAAPATGRRRRKRVLLLVLDGMRPGSISAATTPTLARLAERGVTFTRSRTGFPSETMVGAGELFSGAWPERNGITSNWMIAPGQDREGIELKSLKGIDEMARSYRGRALTSTSVFQALASAGLTSAIIGKEGPAELAWRAGATWAVSSGGSHEDARARGIGTQRGAAPLAQLVADAAGPAPESGKEDDSARSEWLAKVAGAVDAKLAPDLLAVWLTDPDKTQHGHGLDTDNQLSALRKADAAVGALLTQLASRGELDDLDIVITSDHGFSEHLTGVERDLDATLQAAGLDVSHVVPSGNSHLVRFTNPPTARDLARLRAVIASSPFAGDVATVIVNPRRVRGRDSRHDARLTGRDLRLGSTRAADVLVVYRREDAGAPTGENGRRRRRGASLPARAGTMVAGHGSLGWSDLNNTLVVSGPSFERALPGAAPLRTRNAAGIVDVAPTILQLLGAPVPRSMQGRVLREALAELGGVGNGTVEHVRSSRNVAIADVILGSRTIRTELETEHAGGVDYHVALRTSG
jgi:arylsulfatase A-like enzyme